MMRIFFNPLKTYCTKIPVKMDPEKSFKNLKIGSQVSVVKTITNEDILNFAKLSGDYNPIHIDSSKNVVHGAFLNGLLSGVIGMKLPGPGTVIVEQIIKYLAPCYAGDTVETTVEIISVRKVIKCKYIIIANAERIVLKGEAKLIASNARTKKIVFIK